MNFLLYSWIIKSYICTILEETPFSNISFQIYLNCGILSRLDLEERNLFQMNIHSNIDGFFYRTEGHHEHKLFNAKQSNQINPLIKIFL